MTTAPSYVRFFETFGIADVPLVGGKNASLGEMYRELSPKGVRVPNGFAVTADAYGAVLDASGAAAALHEALDGLDPSDVTDLARRARQARDVVYAAGVPPEVEAEILAGYRQLQGQYGEDVRLAVRSSATAEDVASASFAGQLRRPASPASFAGQHDTPLNNRGDQHLRGLAALLREPLHRSGGALPRRRGLRPLQGGALDRGDEDGPFRPRLPGGAAATASTPGSAARRTRTTPTSPSSSSRSASTRCRSTRAP